MKTKLLSTFFTLMLLFSMSAVASAQLEPNFELPYGNHSLEMAPTSDGHVISVQRVRDPEHFLASMYTLVRYNAKGEELKNLPLGIGFQNQISYKGKVYSFFISMDKNEFFVIDEKFDIIYKAPFKSSPYSYITELHDDFVYLNGGDYENQNEITFSLKDMKVIANPKIAVEGYFYVEDGVAHLLTKDGHNNHIFNGEIKHSLSSTARSLDWENTIYNDTIYSFVEDQGSYYMLSVGTDGTKLTATPVNIHVDQYDIFNTVPLGNGKVLFSEQVEDVNDEAFVFIYDLTKHQINNVMFQKGKPNYKLYKEGFIREYTVSSTMDEYENYAISATFYDQQLNKLSTLPPMMNSDNLIDAGDYVIVNLEHYSHGYFSHIYDIKTGELIKTIISSEDGSYKTLIADAITVNGEYIVALSQVQDTIIETQPISAYFVPLNPNNPIGSYTRDKIWTIKFTQDVEVDSINVDTLAVYDSQGHRVRSLVKPVGNIIEVHPPLGGYENGSYTLVVKNLKSVNGQTLKSSAERKFYIR